MEIETREAALCLIRRGNAFLVVEIRDPRSGTVLHRPPGGGIEEGENPEQAVRREILEEMGVRLDEVRALGAVEHIWFWKGREVRERAWLFLANASDDARLSGSESPDLVEADRERKKTLWRPIEDGGQQLPALCPSALQEFLGSL